MTLSNHPMPEIAVAFRARCGNISGALFANAIRFTLRQEKRHAAMISCVVVTDAEIHELNRRFLKHDYPTDIITFPLEDDPIEAELVISADTARRQAREYKVTMREECARLAIHGVLHLCGYDDRSEEDRAAMKSREDFHVRRYMKNERTRH
ncbi:MAG: rRNA maturation RNase YbeY [Bacteroidetes bacterium]|nr:rRNA maturation RNase YbeY [Bacteroidota bacterium]